MDTVSNVDAAMALAEALAMMMENSGGTKRGATTSLNGVASFHIDTPMGAIDVTELSDDATDDA